MTPKEFTAWGEALYGPEWKAPLARELGYNRKTIQRWVSGEWPIPDDVEDELRDLAKGAALREAVRRVAKLKAMVGE